MEKWRVKNKKVDYKKISDRLSIDEIIVRLLINRDIIDDKSMINFVNSDFNSMNDALKLKDVNIATKIIKQKIQGGKKVRIIGDYDVDGVVSTYILYVGLKRCGANVDYEIPDRVKDGYGINKDILKIAYDSGVDTIITCDNGIAAIDEIGYAKDMGMSVIVTDHHDVPFVCEDGVKKYLKSRADAIINPKQIECEYEFKHLCGAGVAFKFIYTLYDLMGIDLSECEEFIQFVAIATVCDVVDLIDENRMFVKAGLDMMGDTSNLGLSALIKETKVDVNNISTYHLGFIIGPCINASGRLDSAKLGLELLLSDNEDDAKNIAKKLYDLNEQRRELTSSGLEKAIELIESENLYNDKVIVVNVESVHESLVGIIAGRIREKYNAPAIVLTSCDDGAKGSARSIEEYNMFDELSKCSDLLLKFGGHPMAAGLSLKAENVDVLRDRLNAQTMLTQDDLSVKVRLDMPLALEKVNFDLINNLKVLEPFGKGNSKPLFGEKNVKILKAKILGKNQNVLKLTLLSRDNKYIEGIYFGDIKKFEEIVVNKYSSHELNNLYEFGKCNIHMDLAYRPSINEYMGKQSIQIVIEHFR